MPLVGSLRDAVEKRREAAVAEADPHGLLWTGVSVTGAPIDPSADNRAWKTLLSGLDVPQARLHDARHAAVTLLYEAGVPEVMAMDIVGHSATAMTRAYRSTGNVEQLGHALIRLQGLVDGNGGD